MHKKKIFNPNNTLHPFIIAEIGVNHNCSLEKAKRMILEAKEGGAQAVKFQSYKAENLVSKYAKAYWDTKKEKIKDQLSLFKKYDKFSKYEYISLFKFCKKKKIIFLSTPFDFEAVDYLDDIVPFYKIASADITNFPLIDHIAKKKKPIILSTGASNILEIRKAVNLIKKRGVKDICLMHCILNYPTNRQDANLLMISHLKNNFPNLTIGYSDHTMPDKNMETLVTASLLGAKIIEKHFTDNKKQKGNDHYHSMDKKDLKIFFKRINYLKKIIGNSSEKKPIISESKSRKFARRSLIAARYLEKGEIIKRQDILCKRPGFGISTNFISKIIGRKVKKKILQDQLLKWSNFK